MSAQINDKKHIHEVEIMNQIMELLKEFPFATQDRILTWVQLRIEHEWVE